MPAIQHPSLPHTDSGPSCGRGHRTAAPPRRLQDHPLTCCAHTTDPDHLSSHRAAMPSPSWAARRTDHFHSPCCPLPSGARKRLPLLPEQAAPPLGSHHDHDRHSGLRSLSKPATLTLDTPPHGPRPNSSGIHHRSLRPEHFAAAPDQQAFRHLPPPLHSQRNAEPGDLRAGCHRVPKPPEAPLSHNSFDRLAQVSQPSCPLGQPITVHGLGFLLPLSLVSTDSGNRFKISRPSPSVPTTTVDCSSRRLSQGPTPPRSRSSRYPRITQLRST